MMPSMLDRLIDTDSSRPGQRAVYNIQQILSAVRRDLENLLNTRQTPDPRIEDHPELARSVFNYGLPDITRRSASTGEERSEICELVEQIIERFEPRLKAVRAVALEPRPGDLQTVRFEIHARLNVDPSPDVTFGTVLELTGHASIQASES
jgi:type VI secretion system protein ImpF